MSKRLQTERLFGEQSRMPALLYCEARLVPSPNQPGVGSQHPQTLGWSGSLVTFQHLNEMCHRNFRITHKLGATRTTVLLMQARLPRLSYLTLSTLVDSKGLRSFLKRHLLLEEVSYIGESETNWNWPPAPKPFVTPPLSHPALKSLETNINSSGGYSLVAGLVRSPCLRNFQFTLPIFPTPAQDNQIFSDLHLISKWAQPGSVNLHFVVSEPEPVQAPLLRLPKWMEKKKSIAKPVIPVAWVDEPIALKIAEGLYYVHTVKFTVSSFATARRLLRWAGTLPNLDLLTFELSQKWARMPELEQLSKQALGMTRADFLRDTQNALPNVGSVVCSL